MSMFGALIVFAVSSLLHPFHISVAEAQWNEDGSRLQVALRLTPRDLDAAISGATGRPVVLERQSDERAAELIQQYVRENFYLSPTPEAAERDDAETHAARRKRFHWVGIEQEVRYTWVYFELERPSGSGRADANDASVWLTNRVIFNAEPTQINTLQLMRTDPPVAVRTTAEEPTKELPATG